MKNIASVIIPFVSTLVMYLLSIDFQLLFTCISCVPDE